MNKKEKTLTELAAMVNGELEGDPEIKITGVADLQGAGTADIAFLVKESNIKSLLKSKAAAVLVTPTVKGITKPHIRVKDPNLAAAIIHNWFLESEAETVGIHPRACVGEGCRIPDSASIGPMAVLGDRVVVGERVRVGPGAVIGNDVTLGNDCRIFANVTLYDRCRLGNRVIIHSGTVMGSDGFGYATDENGRHVKRPHVGIVEVEDDVEIGANVTIDRGTFGRTLIGRGTKIDNLVQIGHNVELGENVLLVAQVGIAGSSILGRSVVAGGQAGIKGHVHLDDGVMIAAKSGVHGNLKKGSIVSGIPAIDHQEWLKASALFARLPGMFKEMRALRKHIAHLGKEARPATQPEKRKKGETDMVQAIGTGEEKMKTDMTPIPIKEILALLPHRYPFILVDRILELEPGNYIKGLKNVTINEPFFQGHFPREPIMPGVLILEGMAQVGGILAYCTKKEMVGEKLIYFAGMDNVRFRHTVVPGDQLFFDLQVLKHKGKIWKMGGKAMVNGKLVAEAELMAAFA